MSKYIGGCQHSPLALQNGCGKHASHRASHGRHPNSQWDLGRLRSTDIAAVVQQTSSDLILKRILFELYRNSQDTGGCCDGKRSHGKHDCQTVPVSILEWWNTNHGFENHRHHIYVHRRGFRGYTEHNTLRRVQTLLACFGVSTLRIYKGTLNRAFGRFFDQNLYHLFGKSSFRLVNCNWTVLCEYWELEVEI